MVTTAVLRRWVSAARVTGPQPHVGKVRLHRPSPRTSDDEDDRRLRPGAGTSIHPGGAAPGQTARATHAWSISVSKMWLATRLAASRAIDGNDVGVQIEGDANRGVAEPLGDHLRMDSSLQRQRRVGVAEVVEADAWHVERAHEPGELVRERRWVDRSAQFVAEHQVDRRNPTPDRRRAVPRVDACGARAARPRSADRGTRAAATRRLRRAHHGLVPTVVSVLHDGELRAVEIDVGPAQAEHLTTPHTGRREQHERRRTAIVLHRRQELAEVVRRPRRELRAQRTSAAGPRPRRCAAPDQAFGVGRAPCATRRATLRTDLADSAPPARADRCERSA